MAGEYTDLTEPEPMWVQPGVENPYEDPWLWRVELYLVSKYQPEFYEATIFKLRAAAIDRGKIVKEHHIIHPNLQSLESQIVSDLDSLPYIPPKSSHHADRNRIPTPGIGAGYQRKLEEL
jgi:hypothetical protein